MDDKKPPQRAVFISFFYLRPLVALWQFAGLAQIFVFLAQVQTDERMLLLQAFSYFRFPVLFCPRFVQTFGVLQAFLKLTQKTLETFAGLPLKVSHISHPPSYYSIFFRPVYLCETIFLLSSYKLPSPGRLSPYRALG